MLAQPWIDASLLPSRSFGPATDPRTFETSMDDARWAAFLGKTPASDYAPLPVSAVLRSASGRYRTGAGAKSARVRLRLIDAASYDEFVGRGVAHDALLVVCCLAAWLPQSNRAEQWLEALNGELAAERAAAPSGRADGGGGGGGGVPFVLAKFDMSQSRLLKERHNIHTIPMYLMYYNGRLAYASNVLNGYGASAEDLRAQVCALRPNARGWEGLGGRGKGGGGALCTPAQAGVRARARALAQPPPPPPLSHPACCDCARGCARARRLRRRERRRRQAISCPTASGLARRTMRSWRTCVPRSRADEPISDIN